MSAQNLDKVWYCRRQGAKQTENFDKRVCCVRGALWGSWCRHSATCRKVVGSICHSKVMSRCLTSQHLSIQFRIFLLNILFKVYNLTMAT
jgi:hypothetical protein